MSSDPREDSEGAPGKNPAAGTIDRHLLEFLVCPMTGGPLIYDAERQELISRSAGRAFPIHDGIPIMLIDEARILDT